MAAKEEFEIRFIKRMTEVTLDISTVGGKQDFIRNLLAYNVILEGIWFTPDSWWRCRSGSGICCATSPP